MNGVWEAVYHGVPMVAVPLFGDQYDNAQRLVSRGMAVKLDISTLTSDELEQAIRIVIRDTRLEFSLIYVEFKRGTRCNMSQSPSYQVSGYTLPIHVCCNVR